MSMKFRSENLPSISVPEFGVMKLSSLQMFVEECGGNSIVEGLTAFDVYDLSLKNAIATSIDKASIFVSFSWKYKFLDVVATLQKLFRDCPDVLIWTDFFNVEKNADFNWENLRSTNEFHHMVLMLSPWNISAPMKRLYCRSTCKCIFDIAMSPADEMEFKFAIEKDCKYAKQLALLSLEKCQDSKVSKESPWNNSFGSLDANLLLSLVKGLGDGFDMCSAIIRLNNITGSLFESISNLDELIVKLEESGIQSSFHQKVIARNILAWKNCVASTDNADHRSMNPNEAEVITTRKYSKSAFQYPIDGIKLSGLDVFISECGGRSMLQGLTTGEVVNMFIKPLIIHEKSSYCDYLKTIDKNNVGEVQTVGEAQVFISHEVSFFRCGGYFKISFYEYSKYIYMDGCIF